MSSKANKDSRLQLVSQIKKYTPHFLHCSVRDCSNRWSKVLKTIFDDDNDMLRGYRKFKDHQNVRVCFMENIFSETQDTVLLKNLANSEASSGILVLKVLPVLILIAKSWRKRIERRKKKPSGKQGKNGRIGRFDESNS